MCQMVTVYLQQARDWELHKRRPQCRLMLTLPWRNLCIAHHSSARIFPANRCKGISWVRTHEDYVYIYIYIYTYNIHIVIDIAHVKIGAIQCIAECHWLRSRCLIFDDSFEHEVKHNAWSRRFVGGVYEFVFCLDFLTQGSVVSSDLSNHLIKLHVCWIWVVQCWCCPQISWISMDHIRSQDAHRVGVRKDAARQLFSPGCQPSPSRRSVTAC